MQKINVWPLTYVTILEVHGTLQINLTKGEGGFEEGGGGGGGGGRNEGWKSSDINGTACSQSLNPPYFGDLCHAVSLEGGLRKVLQ